MGFDALAHYFQSGWQSLMGEVVFNWTSVATALNLITLIDILLVTLIFWWAWKKIKNTNLKRLLPKIIFVLFLMFISKLLGLLVVFYAISAGLVILLIATGTIYTADFKKILEGDLDHQQLARKSIFPGEYSAKKFLSELSDTIVLLAKSKIPSLIIVKTDLPVDKLIDNGTALYTPFSKEFVCDVFSHRSKLSAGAIVVDKGVIVGAGSTLITPNPKRFLFNTTNTAIKQTATKLGALVVITYKDREYISLLHKDSVYAKLSTNNLDRILKTILLA